MQFLADLNDEQRHAVQADGGPLLIVAGPGTGKTKTLTARIAYLLADGLAKSDELIALTFTNKAAREMRERVATLLGGPKASLPLITTFHAFGHQLIKSVGDLQLIDEAVRTQLIRELPKLPAFKGVPVRELSLLLSRAKTAVANTPDQSMQQLLANYQQALAAQQLCDFDDLLCQAYEYLQAHPNKQRYRHVLVDEFQDTSELQYELLRSLSAIENIFAIGDPNQSIYAFRGAGAAMFDRFQADFPQAQSVALTINYRSVPQVVTLANAIFPASPQLVAHQTPPGSVQAIQTLNEHSEAAYILNEIERGIGGSTMRTATSDNTIRQLRDYAVLYRTHRAGQTIRRQFAESGVPCQVVGDESPYASLPIQALIALLRYLSTPDETNRLALSHQTALRQLTLSQIDRLLADVSVSAMTVDMLTALLAERFNLLSENMQQDFQQLLGTFVQFGRGEAGLRACLAHLDVISEQEFYDPSVQAVTLLTIHAAKGLEFEHVFLCAVEEGTLPKLCKNGDNNIDEERRLFYVAVTRARQQLDILYTKHRAAQPATVSRFVSELPTPVLACVVDPAMATLEKRAEKHRQKRAQTSLF